MTHWTKEQQERYAELMRHAEKKPEECWLGYWCSDAHGYPAYDASPPLRAVAGTMHQIEAADPQLPPSISRELSATLDPHSWPGQRVWAVAIHGPRVDRRGKVAGVRREILGEVLPSEALCPRLGARLGRRDLGDAALAGAELAGAELAGADLRGADLDRANLRGANLRGANLRGANLAETALSHANLEGADLTGAYLEDANLEGACLAEANLEGANLKGANLYRAELEGAILREVDLREVNLRVVSLMDADLRYSDLREVDLRREVDLEGADLTGVARAAHDAPIPGWQRDAGRLVRA